ncbi:hypothetical protein [Methanobacterium congolense]|jgi:hypothetical protein|uniref:Uncharacterized protein n=1 Tax=Methanobacterium congolense TaxID=118062 RepID=A0A1D3L2B1_9EURY|nr:hypothetical protein [Methanobacterium congolense]SCG85683.1 putative protein [Methanobacterium congolense]
MAKEIKQLVVGITREGDIVVKSARGRMYPVKKSADLKFTCEDLFEDVETDLFATIDTEAQPWECTAIGSEE